MPPRNQVCPVCRATYAHLPQHLVKFHRVANPQEKMLLLQLSSGRVKGTFQCLVPGCKSLVKRMDRHLPEVHRDIPDAVRGDFLTRAKENYLFSKLAELRASQPSIPMATHLDRAAPLPPSSSDVLATPSTYAVSTSRQPVLTSEASTESQRGCRDATCMAEKAAMQQQIDELRAQVGGAHPGECRNPACVVQSAELTKYVRHFVRSPKQTTRKKFSRSDNFVRGENPKYEHVLQKFLKFCTGCDASSKKVENVRTAVSHVRRFLIYAGQGHLLRGDFLFLKNASCISSWIQSLQNDGFKPTTLRIKLLNVKKFLHFLLHFSQKETKLSGVDFRRLNMELQAHVRDLSRDVTTHQQRVKKDLSNKIAPKEDTQAFSREVRKLLPKKLRRLEQDPSWETLEQVFGLLAGYLICIPGYRRGVLENMLVSEVENAETEGDDTIIEVSRHNSASTYGYARLSLKKEEYGWFTTLLELRAHFIGGESATFFFNRSGGACRRLLQFFQTEWTRMGFSGVYTFKNLRTSMVHPTKNLSPKKRAQVHQAMCHSEAVAAKLYKPLNTASEDGAVRQLQLEDSSSDGGSPGPSQKRQRVEFLQALSFSSSESGVEALDEEGTQPRQPFVLQTPQKSQATPTVQVIGQDPSPGHSYLGRPYVVGHRQANMLILSSDDEEDEVTETTITISE